MSNTRSSTQRDRHGHGRRGPMAWPPIPAMGSRAAIFDELVLDSIDRLRTRVGAAFPRVDFIVELVPHSDSAPWEFGEVPLGRLIAGRGSQPTQIVLFRRPIETRALDIRDLAVLVHDVVTEQVANLMGVEPEDLEN